MFKRWFVFNFSWCKQACFSEVIEEIWFFYLVIIILRCVVMFGDVTLCEKHLFFLRETIAQVFSDICYCFYLFVFIRHQSLAQKSCCLHSSKKRRSQDFYAISHRCLRFLAVAQLTRVQFLKQTDTHCFLTFKFLNFLRISKPFLCLINFFFELWFVLKNVFFDPFTSVQTLNLSIISETWITIFKCVFIVLF